MKTVNLFEFVLIEKIDIQGNRRKTNLKKINSGIKKNTNGMKLSCAIRY